MKKLHPVLFILFILLLADSNFSQRRLGGRVTEIIDGKTVTVETVGGKLTAVLLYIEIPAPDQPLFETVREHLGKLVLGKHVNFQVHGIMSAKTLGQLYLNGVDIGEQLVCDGAAWHLPADQSGQDIHGSTLYEGHQMQAKREKRGVWSIENLKPAWQFRAEKEEDQRRQKILPEQSAAKTAVRFPSIRTGQVAAAGPTN